jgi:hypothetical protein
MRAKTKGLEKALISEISAGGFTTSPNSVSMQNTL